MIWDDVEKQLIIEAQVILLTGWSHEQYKAAPKPLIGMIVQMHRAMEEVKAKR